MGRRLRLHAAAAALGLAGSLVLGGCADLQAGLGSVGVGTEAFVLVSATPDLAVISAGGRDVAIAPAPGFCLATDSVEISRRSAVALIADCALYAETISFERTARGELILPRALPGIMTVSVSGASSIGGEPIDFNSLTGFLRSEEGLQQMGRTPDAAEVKLVDLRQTGQGLFAFLDDGGAPGGSMFAPRYWRAFVLLNDRLCIVTLSGFVDRPIEQDQMLGILTDQVASLQTANRDLPRIVRADGGAVTVASGEPIAVIQPNLVPPRRPEAVSAVRASAAAAPSLVITPTDASRLAPRRAPRAPRKPV